MSSGVTAGTWQNLIMDAAVAYINYGSTDSEHPERILGATNGGVSFGWSEFETRQPEIDGLKGHMRGATRIIRAVPQVSVNLVEWSKENLLLTMPGAVEELVGSGAERVSVFSRSARLIPLSDYIMNVALVGTLSGSDQPVVALVKNALVLEGMTIPTEQNSESTAEVVFVGHYDPADPEDEPWEIRYPNPDNE